jgi:hypothetical protein
MQDNHIKTSVETLEDLRKDRNNLCQFVNRLRNELILAWDLTGKPLKKKQMTRSDVMEEAYKLLQKKRVAETILEKQGDDNIMLETYKKQKTSHGIIMLDDDVDKISEHGTLSDVGSQGELIIPRPLNHDNSHFLVHDLITLFPSIKTTGIYLWVDDINVMFHGTESFNITCEGERQFGDILKTHYVSTITNTDEITNIDDADMSNAMDEVHSDLLVITNSSSSSSSSSSTDNT